VNDVVLVAVVDALEDLFHQDGGITLREFTSLENFIEQLSSLADPMR